MRGCKYAPRCWDEPPGLLAAILRPPEEKLPESEGTQRAAVPREGRAAPGWLEYLDTAQRGHRRPAPQLHWEACPPIPLGPILSPVSVTAALYPRPVHSPRFSPSFHVSPACPCVVSSSKVNGSEEGSPPPSSASMRRGSGSEDSQTTRYRERGCRRGALSLMSARRSVSVPVPVCGGWPWGGGVSRRVAYQLKSWLRAHSPWRRRAQPPRERAAHGAAEAVSSPR